MVTVNEAAAPRIWRSAWSLAGHGEPRLSTGAWWMMKAVEGNVHTYERVVITAWETGGCGRASVVRDCGCGRQVVAVVGLMTSRSLQPSRTPAAHPPATTCKARRTRKRGPTPGPVSLLLRMGVGTYGAARLQSVGRSAFSSGVCGWGVRPNPWCWRLLQYGKGVHGGGQVL